jgi:hypothetical protein
MCRHLAFPAVLSFCRRAAFRQCKVWSHENESHAAEDVHRSHAVPRIKKESNSMQSTVRQAVLNFIDRRVHRMATWVGENHPDIEVRE